jgi:hypothetical protein
MPLEGAHLGMAFYIVVAQALPQRVQFRRLVGVFVERCGCMMEPKGKPNRGGSGQLACPWHVASLTGSPLCVLRAWVPGKRG